LTQERFIKLIDNPDLVATITYEELKTLAFEYPYAHNLRYLLALKAQQEDHPEAARMLQNASAHSIDRTRLFMLIVPRQLTPQRVALTDKEEVLELKPIETVQAELDALVSLSLQPPVERANNAVEMPFPIQPVQPDEPEMQEELPENAPGEPAPHQDVAAPAPEMAIVAAPEVPVEEPASAAEPAPVTSLEEDYQPFIQWFSQFHPPSLIQPLPEKEIPAPPPPVQEQSEFDDEPRVVPPKQSAQPTVAQSLAEKSVSENKDVISETLAKLLAKQGHRDKAADMYERLRLAFPEKSAYFAAEIEKLKK
jgi:hypothetical protein